MHLRSTNTAVKDLARKSDQRGSGIEISLFVYWI